MPSQDEDGPWEAPLVPNTEALANNPRLLVDAPARNANAQKPTTQSAKKRKGAQLTKAGVEL
jgi:hypothetical protein